ncbi:Eco57I restriction-modification methylase domain-containing protein [Paratractidigestivibacter faecalis]|uniref:Eco57I restriction-modification methylase domain-containing protein n=1 Tax=Paratractidigestivibacter faecalis TaxID=2292441 RepID=UPI00388F5DA1
MRTELEPLDRSYDVVVANPPYMGLSNMDKWLAAWVKSKYKAVYRDLCTCFIKRGMSLAKECGYEALVTSDTCMYLSSFEQMRKTLIERTTIIAFIDTRGSNAHPDVFDANAGWVLWNAHSQSERGAYFKLNHPIDEKSERLLEALANPGCGWFYRRDADAFSQIPGSPIAYWTSNGFREAFVCGMPLGNLTDTHLGMATCDNNRFLREWWEVPASGLAKPANYPYDFTEVSWIPYCKGGSFRKWSGNDEWVVNWKNKGSQLENAGAVMVNDSLRFRAMDSWTRVSSGALAVRFKRQGYLFDMTGPGAFGSELDLKYVLAFLNSQVGLAFASFLSASLDFQPGQIGRYPLIKSSVEAASVEFAANKCIRLSSSDWDSFETSWEFERHPLI